MITVELTNPTDGSTSTITLDDPVINSQTTHPVNAGETTVVSGFTNNGDAGSIVCNAATLPTGTPVSMSMDITAAAGQLILCLFDATGPNGGPGKLVATTAAFTPVVGWNTQPFTTQVAVTAGNYWLGYAPSSNSLSYPTDLSMGKYAVGSHAFGAPPATFPAKPTTGTGTWSLYVTVNVPGPPPPPPPPPPTPKDGVLNVGTWSWGEYGQATLYPLAKQMGEQIHRIDSRGLDDQVFAALLDVGCKVLVDIWPPNLNPDVPTVATTNAQIDVVLKRYGPGGTYFTDNPTAPNRPVEGVEILNEPNWYLPGNTQQDKAVLYAPILVAAYQHVKATWPSVLVVGCVMGDGNLGQSNLTDFLPALFQANSKCATSFDVFSFHPYTAPTPPDQIVDGTQRLDTHVADLRAVLAQYGVPSTVPIWNTEVGWSITQAEGGATADDPTQDVTLAQQAAYSVRMDVLCCRLGIPRVYHMVDVDSDGFNGGFWQWNASANTFQTRPIATATQHEISLLNGATAITVVAEDFGGGAPFVYKFTTPTGTVLVAWAQTPQTYTITGLTGTTKVTDYLGNAIATITTASYAASLSETPIWLQLG